MGISIASDQGIKCIEEINNDMRASTKHWLGWNNGHPRKMGIC